jgi:hypothetical protein
MATITKLNLAKANLDKKNKNISFHWDGGSWPKDVEVTSHITGAIVKYKPAPYEHPKFDPDGWDGMATLYVPVNDADTQWTMSLFIA